MFIIRPMFWAESYAESYAAAPRGGALGGFLRRSSAKLCI